MVEAPRGTLFHHYETDENGLITKANLIVATQNNAARIAMSVEKAAKRLDQEAQMFPRACSIWSRWRSALRSCYGCATPLSSGKYAATASRPRATGKRDHEPTA